MNSSRELFLQRLLLFLRDGELESPLGFSKSNDPLVGHSRVSLLSLEALLETWDLLQESPLVLILLLFGLVFECPEFIYP